MNTVSAKPWVFAERSVTKVVAVFSSQAEANQARGRLAPEAGWASSQLRVLGPPDAGSSTRSNLLARQMEPEGGSIFHTLLRAHATFGLAGFVLGLALWAWLRESGPAFIAASPALSLLVLVFFSTVAGLMLGGLVTLRPDHTAVIRSLRDDLHQGRWALVAHPIDDEQVQQALRVLEPGSLRMDRTL